MTLHQYPHIEPRSDEWHDLRRGMITASAVGKLITPKTVKVANNDDSRSYTTQLATERITGYTEPTYTSEAMWRGIEDEPRAIQAYSDRYKVPVARCGFMVRDDWGHRIGYSPDGLVGDDRLIEIKSRTNRLQLVTILTDEVPLDAIAQCQAGLLVSGRDWLDYVSYSGGMPMYIKRVYPSTRWHDAIIEATAAAESIITDMATVYAVRTQGLPVTERIIEQEMTLP